MQQQKKSFFERFSVAFSKPQLWEKCRELSILLPHGTPNEIHAVFGQICGDIFGYGAGGVGFGWDLASLSRSSGSQYSHYGGLTKSYRDFHEVLTFLGSRGPLFDVIHRLMHDPSHVYEFPTSQLPQNYQKSNLHMGGTIGLTAFEYYLYHFASLLVRRQKLNLAPSNVNINSNTGENLYPLLLEDYLACYLPIDPNLQSQLFTQPLPSALTTSPSATIPSPTSSAKKSARPSLFKKDFSPRMKAEEPRLDFNPVRNNSKPTATSNETWRSDTLVRVIIMFWIDNYSGEEGSSDSLGDSSPGSPTKTNLDYVSASLRVASTLPSPELMRVVRMFIKHSHYFANLSHQGSMFLPASMKVDIFGSRTNKNILLAFLARSIDHWPYDASFRFVLEAWLSYIQPWRYLNINESEEDQGNQKLDTAKFSTFISENFMFYSKLLSKVLNRFLKLEVGSPKNAFMLFRVFKVFAQDNLFPCLKSIAFSQGYNLNQSQNMKKVDNIFSDEFKDLMSSLMVSVLKSIQNEKKRSSRQTEDQTKTANSKSFFTSLAEFINGGPSTSVADTEKQESDKLIQHLKYISERMVSMFELTHIQDQFMKNLETTRKDSVDESDYNASPFVGLSPEQRRGILSKKIKANTQYKGHPDQLPIRSDEVAFLVRIFYQLSCYINEKWSDKIEETYYRNDLVGSVFREVATGPTTYMTRIDHIDSSLNNSRLLNSSLHGMPMQQTKLPPRIILRSLGSYIAVSYFLFYLFFMMILLGKSSVTTMVVLAFGFAITFITKALINPSKEVKPNYGGSIFSESFS